MIHSPQDIELQASVADFATAPPLRTLRDKIDRLNISADTKALLMDIAAVTLKVGDKVLAFVGYDGGAVDQGRFDGWQD